MRLVLLIVLFFSSLSLAFESRGESFDEYVTILYNDLDLEKENLSYDVLWYALLGRGNLTNAFYGLIDDRFLTIIDYSKSSNKKRMYVIDLEDRTLLFRVFVAHAKNTGDQFAKYFSNKPGSNKSSLGFYVTLNSYVGSHGNSLRLEGMENGFNDNAFDRAIVMHGAEYVSQDFINRYGRLGRSLGCPAIPLDYVDSIIPLISAGSVLFIYYPDRSYLTNSKLLKRIPASGF